MNRENIIEIIHNKNLSIKHVSKLLNISRESFYKKLDGRSEFKMSELKKLKEILDLDVESWFEIFFK